MRKIEFSQSEIDKMVVAERIPLDEYCGSAYNDVRFKVRVGGMTLWQYDLWKSMLRRCYNDGALVKNPNYIGCSVCNEWFSFGNFLEWVNREIGYKGKPAGFELDKDILARGNKVYSPETCSLVPKIVNTSLINCLVSRGKWPIGVHLNRPTGKFAAQIRVGIRRKKYLGCYKTPEEAFAVYKVAKEAQIKVVAMQHKDVLKPAVFESLMNWEIEP